MKKNLLLITLMLSGKIVCSQANWQIFDCYAQYNPVMSNSFTNGMDVFLDNYDNPWVTVAVSQSPYIGRFVNNAWTFTAIPVSYSIYDVVFDDENNPWLETNNSGIYRVQNGTATSISNTNSVRGLYKFDNDPMIYMITGQKVIKVNPSTPNTQVIIYEQSINASPVTAFTKGLNNELLIHKKDGDNDSLLVIDINNNILGYNLSNQLGDNPLGMKVGSDGKVWFYFTEGGGDYNLYSYDYQNVEQFTVPNPSGGPESGCWNFEMDDNDDIWLYFEKNIIKFNGSSFANYYVHTAPYSATGGYSRMHFRKDNHSNIWFISFDNLRRGLAVVNHRGLTTIEGTTFIDTDQSQSYNSGDLTASIPLETTSGFILTDADGSYNLFAPTNTPVNISADVPVYFGFTTPSTYTLTPSPDLVYVRDFGIYPVSNARDLSVSHVSSPCRPGFVVNQWINYTNSGTAAESGTIQYTFDSELSYISSEPAAASVQNNIITWNYTDFNPLSSATIHVLFSLNPSTPANDTLNGTVEIMPVSNDVTPENNVYPVNNIVTSSFDPNDKMAVPDGNISTGDWINYTIRFQNTGNDTAFNIYLLDSLSPSLDFSTISINGYSHTVRYSLTNGWLEFWFDDILLPDSTTNEILSHGFVSYKIRTKPTLSVGTEIKNKAKIYFDFNQPIITNTTLNTIGLPIGIDDKKAYPVLIYPNPFTTWTTFQTDKVLNAATLTLYNSLGQNVKQLNNINGRTITLQRDNLPSGLYYLQLTQDNQTIATDKLVITD